MFYKCIIILLSPTQIIQTVYCDWTEINPTAAAAAAGAAAAAAAAASQRVD